MDNKQQNIKRLLLVLFASRILYQIAGLFSSDLFNSLKLQSVFSLTMQVMLILGIICYGLLSKYQIMYSYAATFSLVSFLCNMIPFPSEENLFLAIILLILIPLMSIIAEYCICHSHGDLAFDKDTKLKDEWYQLFYYYLYIDISVLLSSISLIIFKSSFILLISSFVALVASIGVIVLEILHIVKLYKMTKLF